MSRTAAVRFVFGLFALGGAAVAPSLLVAQDPPTATVPAGAATYTVRSGETLSGIAEAQLGSAAAWREIYELNRERIADPNRITPGTLLVLPGSGTRVTGVQVTGGGPVTPRMAPAPSNYRERRSLLERRPFEPQAAPEPSESSRTILYGSPAREVVREGASQVLLLPVEEVPVVQTGVARGAGWVVADEASVGEVGELRRFATERSLRIEAATLLAGEDAVLRLAPNQTVRIGDRFTTARQPRQVRGFGWVVIPTGLVEVRSMEGDEAVVRVLDAWDPVQLGNILVTAPVSSVPIGVTPRPATRELTADIVAFEEPKELYLTGDRLFVNRGSADGLSLGDRFVVRAEALSETGNGNSAVVAEMDVVRVQDGTATLRLLRLVEPREVRIGATLHLSAEMP